jgi:hypothetical protein
VKREAATTPKEIFLLPKDKGERGMSGTKDPNKPVVINQYNTPTGWQCACGAHNAPGRKFCWRRTNPTYSEHTLSDGKPDPGRRATIYQTFPALGQDRREELRKRRQHTARTVEELLLGNNNDSNNDL